MTTNTTQDHRRAFKAPTSGEAVNFCVFSCFLSRQPAAAIAAVTVCPPAEEGGEPDYVISPLFVSITDDMVLTRPRRPPDTVIGLGANRRRFSL